MIKNIRFLLIITLVFASCKAKKNLINAPREIKKMSVRKIVKNHYLADFNKKTIDASISAKYKDKKQNVSFSVRMKIKKDEVIWVRGTKLITVFKIKITPTTVSYYSPYKKNYFVGNFNLLEKMLGAKLSFKQLQDMLLGQAIFNLKNKSYNVRIKDKSYVLSPEIQSPLFDVFFKLNAAHFKMDEQLIKNDLKSQSLQIQYADYSTIDNQIMPGKIYIIAKSKKNYTRVEMIYNSVNFNTELVMPFRIPSSYKRIKL